MDIDIPAEVSYKIAQYVPSKLEINFDVTLKNVYMDKSGFILTIEMTICEKISLYKHIIMGYIKINTDGTKDFIIQQKKNYITMLIDYILHKTKHDFMIGIINNNCKITTRDLGTAQKVYYQTSETKSFIIFKNYNGFLLEKYEINKDKLVKTLLEFADKL